MLCLLSWHWRLKVQGLTARMKQTERAARSSGGNINTYDLSYDISSKALLHDIQSCCPIKHNTGACWCVPWPLNPKATSRMKKVFFKQSVLERTTACVTTTSLRNHDRIEALKFWYFIKKKMFPAPRLKSRPQVVVKQNVLSSSWSDDVIVTHPRTTVTSQQIGLLPVSSSQSPPPGFLLPVSSSRSPQGFLLPVSSRFPPPGLLLPVSSSRFPPPGFLLPVSTSRFPPPGLLLPVTFHTVAPEHWSTPNADNTNSHMVLRWGVQGRYGKRFSVHIIYLLSPFNFLIFSISNCNKSFCLMSDSTLTQTLLLLLKYIYILYIYYYTVETLNMKGYMYIYIYVCIHTHIYIYICAYIYIKGICVCIYI